MTIRVFACFAILLAADSVSAASPNDRVVHNSIGMTFVRVPAGQFMMGSAADDPQASRDEQPRHAVRITKSFYLGMFEVTQEEYEKVMGHDPSSFSVLGSAKSKRHADLIVTCANQIQPLSANLPERVATEIGKLAGVSAVCPGLVDFQTIEECGDDPVGVQGWPAGNYMFQDLKIIRGANLTERDRGSKAVVIGSMLATVKKLKVGQTITIADEKLTVVGVFESAEDLENGMVIMPLDVAQKVLGRAGKMTGCTVIVKDSSAEGIAAVRAEIEGRLAERCGMTGKIRAKSPFEFVARSQVGRDFRYPPVESVSWNDAQEFCRRLSELPAEKPGSRHYRLPTEAEWEYAARAGVSERRAVADATSKLHDAAWYLENSRDSGRPHPVGQKALNAWGLCDMYGNVAEWCADGYSVDYYVKPPVDDPAGPSVADARVIRGGSWNHPASACRPAARSSAKPDARSAIVGFRVVLHMTP